MGAGVAAEPEQAEETGALPEDRQEPESVEPEPVEPASVEPESVEPEEAPPDEVRPEDVREGVVDVVAYAVGALALIALGYFTQRDVLTWTRGPFTVVCIIMAVHWVGRRVQARRTKNGASATEKAGEAR
jgi:hypothetical protein